MSRMKGNQLIWGGGHSCLHFLPLVPGSLGEASRGALLQIYGNKWRTGRKGRKGHQKKKKNYDITEGSELNNFCVVWGHLLMLLSCLFLPLRQAESEMLRRKKKKKKASFLLNVIRLSEYWSNKSSRKEVYQKIFKHLANMNPPPLRLTKSPTTVTGVTPSV